MPIQSILKLCQCSSDLTLTKVFSMSNFTVPRFCKWLPVALKFFLKSSQLLYQIIWVIHELNIVNNWLNKKKCTSVPDMPIEIPMSANFKAGASLTPSPVMATTSPSSLSNLTISCLCLGSARENKRPPFCLRCAFWLRRFMKSFPVKLLDLMSSLGPKTPISWHMASAVFLLSPVMTTTRMPAALQSSIAWGTSSLGGS